MCDACLNGFCCCGNFYLVWMAFDVHRLPPPKKRRVGREVKSKFTASDSRGASGNKSEDVSQAEDEDDL